MSGTVNNIWRLETYKYGFSEHVANNGAVTIGVNFGDYIPESQ